MPWRTEWVDPELFLEHKGVKVYHSYKDNDVTRPLMFWYTTNPDYFEDVGGKADPYEFDVRDLIFPELDTVQQIVDALSGQLPPVEEIKMKIRRAIDADVISAPVN